MDRRRAGSDLGSGVDATFSLLPTGVPRWTSVTPAWTAMAQLEATSASYMLR